MAQIKSFGSYLDEASLQGNVGIPGESGKGDKKYLANVERRAKEKMGQTQRELGGDINRFMQLVRDANSIQKPYKEELEKIAKESILLLYGDILDGVNLDVKFAKEGEIPKIMSETPEEPEMEALEELKDKGIISAVQMRKIGNNIGQGEAKTVKKALNLPETKDAVISLMGQETGEKYISLLNKIADIASFYDWAIPMEVQKEMWQRDKSGFSGSAKVEWDSKEDGDKKENMEEFLKSLESGSGDPGEIEDNLENLTGIKVIARGTDLGMLFHESIKGIWQLILANNIPSDPEAAEAVVMNTDTLADELEDLRYGPYIAADLRDFINTFSESKTIENLKERVAGVMMTMNPEEFLEFFRHILNGYVLEDSASLEIAKSKMQEIIDGIAEELKNYDLKAAGIDTDDEEFEDPGVETTEEPAETDYSKMSKKQLQELIDKYLEGGEFGKIDEILPYLNESQKMRVAKAKYPDQGYPNLD